MSFISLNFVVLFACTFILYHTLPSRFRKATLLTASCLFIGFYHLTFLITALILTLTTFYLGKWIGQTKRESSMKGTYFSGVCFLVVSWLAFRYADRLTDCHILFPLGISFYTFQAISYLTEIYWQEEEPEKSLPDFMIYMLFFMKFLSGPIERAGDMLPQLKSCKATDYASMVYGMRLIVVGLIKKLILADSIAPYIDGVFGSVYTAGRAIADGMPPISDRAVCRLLRIYRHRIGRSAHAGIQAQPKLQPAVHCADHCRLLAPMAHVAFILGTRLSVPPVVLEPAWMGTMGRISKSGADLHGTGYLAWCRMELCCLRTNSRCHHLLRDEDHDISPQTESPIGEPLICHTIRRKDLPAFCRLSDILPSGLHGRSVPLHQPPLLRRTLQLEGNEHRNAGPQQHCGRKRTRTDIGLRIFHVQA
jgi:hypothetical protein